MGKNNCGCGGQSSDLPDHDGLMIKASPASAARCGTGQTPGTSENCTREDNTYDLMLNAYTVPANQQNAPIVVCNGSLYAPGQWFQFLYNGAILQVQTIAGNQITLKNGCPNLALIPGNVIGDIIPANTPFIVVGKPACQTSTEQANEFQARLATQTKLCVPNMTQNTSNTAEMQFVGWKRADSSDSNFQKCIERIRGIYKKGKSVFATEIEQVPSSDIALYRNLMRHKATGEIREIINASEDPDLEAGEKYVKMFVSGAEALVGPAYIFVPVYDSLYQNSSLTDEEAWLTINEATPLEEDINLSISSINELTILGDRFYANVQFNFGIRQPAGFGVGGILEVNGSPVTRVGCQGSYGFNSVTIPVMVEKSDKKITIKVTVNSAGNPPRVHISAKLVGVFL
jgi:hypothetical protein